MRRLFGTNGIRGIVNGETLNAELALGIGSAVGTLLHKDGRRRVTIGTDTRTSNDMLKHAVVSGLLSAGCVVADLGVAPTPAIQYAVKTGEAEFGVIITASHNPPEFNGIKCVDGDGTELPADKEREIESIYFSGEFHRAAWREVRGVRQDTGAISRYIDGVLSQVDVERLRKAGLKVVLDCANGTAGLSSPFMLDRMGCKVVTLNAQPQGTFPGHESEPTEANVQDLIVLVKASGADLGAVHDGDGDRTVFVDEKGSFIQGDQALALISREMVAEAGGGTVVTTVSSSSSVEDAVKAAGGDVVFTRVGSPVVTRKMMETGAVFGGEESGGLIFPKHQFCKEGGMSLAKMLDIMAKHGKPLSELLAEIPSYSLHKLKVECPDELKDKALELFASAATGDEVVTIDGVKVFSEMGWVLVRPSGTEPACRVYAEAKDDGTARRLAEDGMARLRECIAKAGG